MAPRTFALVVASLLTHVVACADTPGTPTLSVDASRASFPDDAGCVPGSDAGAALGPASYDALYADLFRHEGVAKCQTAGSCHGGTTSGTGLPMGSTSHDLYCALVNKTLGTKQLVAKGASDRSASAIVDVIWPSPSGDPAYMPNTTVCDLHNRKLLPEELDRVGAWLDRGAPEDDGDGGVIDAACPAFTLP